MFQYSKETLKAVLRWVLKAVSLELLGKPQRLFLNSFQSYDKFNFLKALNSFSNELPQNNAPSSWSRKSVAHFPGSMQFLGSTIRISCFLPLHWVLWEGEHFSTCSRMPSKKPPLGCKRAGTSRIMSARPRQPISTWGALKFPLPKWVWSPRPNHLWAGGRVLLREITKQGAGTKNSRWNGRHKSARTATHVR